MEIVFILIIQAKTEAWPTRFPLPQMCVVLAKSFILVKITKITIYLYLYLHSLKTKPPNLIFPMSVVVLLEASFWSRFSQWDILGKMRKTVTFTLYASISLFNISVPHFTCLLSHSCILSQKSEVTGPLSLVTISTLISAKVWAENRVQRYCFQRHFHLINNQKF